MYFWPQSRYCLCTWSPGIEKICDAAETFDLMQGDPVNTAGTGSTDQLPAEQLMQTIRRLSTE